MRPLISTGDPKKSVDISRKAELYETSSGLVTITGGKLTTWRRMAKMAVDRIVEREGRDAPCRTHEIPLGQPAEPEDLPDVVGVDDESLALLAHRYGYAARGVLALADEQPALAQRIVPDLPDLLAEAPFSVRNEQSASAGRRAAAANAPRAARRRAGSSTRDGRPGPHGRRGDGARDRLGQPRGSTSRSTAGSKWRGRGDRAAGPSRRRRRVRLRLREQVLELRPGAPLVMGIVNATPESFSDGGCCRRARRAGCASAGAARWGADLIDVGASPA